MKKCIYLLALVLIPAIGMSQKMDKKDTKKAKAERTSSTKNNKNKAALMKQLAVVKQAIISCDHPKADCTIFDEFASKIEKQTMQAQIKSILSSGFGSNFMTEMAKFEKMLMDTKTLSEKELQTMFKKAPSYKLTFVKSRIRMEEKRMEMVWDDDDDE